MDDLTITRLCAEAMGWRPAGERKDFDSVKAIPVEQFPGAPHYQYAPLRDDAAAMALVKKLHIAISILRGGGWMSHCEQMRGWIENVDLNRAICECCAKVMLAKKGASDDAKIENKDRG